MVIKKRVLQNKPDKYYKKLVKRSLHPKSIFTNNWGCLNKNGKLFRIATLTHTNIPKRILKKLQSKGKIKLEDDGYYKWVMKKEV